MMARGLPITRSNPKQVKQSYKEEGGVVVVVVVVIVGRDGWGVKCQLLVSSS